MLNVAPSVLGRFSKISRNGKRVSEEETLENAFADDSAPSTKQGSSEGKKARKKKERARNANRPRFRRRRCAARQRNVRKGEPEKGEAFATRKPTHAEGGRSQIFTVVHVPLAATHVAPHRRSRQQVNAKGRRAAPEDKEKKGAQRGKKLVLCAKRGVHRPVRATTTLLHTRQPER